MYKDPKLSPIKRAEHLLSKMTVDDKIDQMITFGNFNNFVNNVQAEKELPLRCSVFGNLGNVEDEDFLDKMQEHFKNTTEYGIPVLMMWESLHGLAHKKATVFPQCAGLGGSFDTEGIHKMAQIIGREARAVGVRQVFAPNIDIPRDPRWGRTQEAYGEDPYLVGEMGEQYVKGIQENGVAATAKHYIAYGYPEGGLNLSPSHIGEREIREVLLEPFKKCIDAGVMSVMPSYNEVDGEPVHASKKYLRDILRDELGFKGTTVSDWVAIKMLHYFQNVAPDYFTAGKMAIEAGMDIEAPEDLCYGCEEFRKAARNGEIDIKLIDEAVLRILELKFKLGLFEDPYSDKELIKQMNCDEAKALAKKLDEESILLLKNDGLLPLDENKISKIAVIGNNAKDSFLGDYIDDRTENCIDFYEGMVNRLGKDRVLYAKGCEPISYTEEEIKEAVDTAKQADVVMLVLGDRAIAGGGEAGGEFMSGEITCAEGYDVHDLSFPPSQKRLFDEVSKLNKPILLVVYGGRPFTIQNEADKSNAFMFSWGGGEQSGNAFASLIFGDRSPSAKLSFSFPQSVGHIPCHYLHKPTARGSHYNCPGSIEKPGRNYVTSSPDAWYPFGFGLSYTTIEYSHLEAEVLENGNVEVKVTVENKGNYEIYESVLLYVKMMYCPITPFVKKLRKFKKINLKPNDKKTVEFTLTDEDFTYIDVNMKTVKNTGEHKILIENLEFSINI